MEGGGVLSDNVALRLISNSFVESIPEVRAVRKPNVDSIRPNDAEVLLETYGMASAKSGLKRSHSCDSNVDTPLNIDHASSGQTSDGIRRSLDVTVTYGVCGSPWDCEETFSRVEVLDGLKMERLSRALQLQKDMEEYITKSHLNPLRAEMRTGEKQTLAQLARELRLTKLINILENLEEVEDKLTQWFSKIDGPIARDIDDQLELTLSIIEAENVDIRESWFTQKSPDNPGTPGDHQSSQKRPKLDRIPSSLRKSVYDVDPTIFRRDDDTVRHELENKMAHLHRALYRILSAIKHFVEVICECEEHNGLQLGLTGADVHLIMVRFPQTYLLDEEQ